MMSANTIQYFNFIPPEHICSSSYSHSHYHSVNKYQVSESDCFDKIENELKQGQSNAGHETGFDLGQKDGRDEGYSQGLTEGQKVGSEVGFYRGFTMTWLQLIKSDSKPSTRSAKVLKTLNEVLELADAFPKTNETTCEEKLSKIRVKFKQSSSLLKLKL